MSLSRWWFGEPMMLSQLRRMQQEMLREAEHTTREYAGVYPAVNLHDDGESFMVRAEIPGVDKTRLDITTKGNQVSIRGERNTPNDETAPGYHRRERQMGVFHRVVTLPEQVDSSKTVANYKNGVLEIICPRAEASKARKVQIA